MKQGKCPKCGSSQIYCSTDLPLKSGPFGSNSIPISLASLAALDNYACTACGYVEHYIADTAMLTKIAGKWTPVPPPAPSSDSKNGN